VAAEEPLSRRDRARAVRAVARAQRVTRGLGRIGLWVTIVLFLILFSVLAFLWWFSREPSLATDSEWHPELRVFGPWSVLAMAVLPAWAFLLVLMNCAVSFAAEREAGTLDALRLTPISFFDLARALMRPRLRLGVLILLIGLPFYLLPRSLPGITGHLIEPREMGNTALVSTFGRGYFLLHIANLGWDLRAWLHRSLWSGVPALIVDVTRLYAAAAIGTAVSLGARTATRAGLWALFWGVLFLCVTVGAEWLGALAVLPLGHNYISQACLILLICALVFEAGLGNLLVPWLVLRAAARRAFKL